MPPARLDVHDARLTANLRQLGLVFDPLLGFTSFARPARSQAYSSLVAPLKEA